MIGGGAFFFICITMVSMSPLLMVGACKCAPMTFNNTMREAKWGDFLYAICSLQLKIFPKVSHVVVLNNKTSVENLHINYTIKHLEVFKVRFQ